MRQRIKSERGSAIVTAVAFMAVMIAVGLAAFALTDNQQALGGKERVRESSFNLAEGLLGTQSYILSRGWPSKVGVQPYQDCTQGSAAGFPQFCPQPSELGNSFNQKDFTNNDLAWTTSVRDDTGSQFYDYAAVDARPHYDQNGNNRVWVRAQSTIRRKSAPDCDQTNNGTGASDRCRTRAVVALLEIEEVSELIPKRVVIAGKLAVTPNGNHPYIKTNPDTTATHNVTVRCNPPATPSSKDPCVGFDPDKNRPQIDPEGAYEQGYVNTDALPDDQKQRLKERAMADGTYYNGCPTTAQLTGKVVWVANCSYGNYQAGGQTDWNSSANPGMLIWEDGLLRLESGGTFWGIIYHLSDPDPCGNVVELRGGLTVEGGVFVDGNCGLDVGSNSVNINFNANAFGAISTFGTAAVVQNSWREVRCEPYPAC